LVFADQLGPEFIDDYSQIRIVIESRASFRRPMHFAKAQLMLSALRHAEVEAAVSTRLIVADTFSEGVAEIGGDFEVIAPTSFRARALMQANPKATVLPSRGFVTSETDFASWVKSRGKKRLVMEDFYRYARDLHGVLMQGPDPLGGKWNFDHENREPPPKGESSLGLPKPWQAAPDVIDEKVDADLARWQKDAGFQYVGKARSRIFPVTPVEAGLAFEDFLGNRMATFGPFEDAMMTDDWLMSHSAISMALNLGLISPRHCVKRAEGQLAKGAPIASVEGFVRQVMGWRDFIWHLYWHFGPAYVQDSNALSANSSLPTWFAKLDGGQVRAKCLSLTLNDIHERAWAHHIPRLMILANWAMQRGYQPQEMVKWFKDMFVDGFEWVMAANVIGMGLYADGGKMSTKPYAAGGAYINRMSNYCNGCQFDPKVRVGEKACPFTAGYWSFLARNEPLLRGNHRMSQPLAGLRRLKDLPQVLETFNRFDEEID
jgi:deoxyribodipyrimidine photolyase-related protein